MSKDRQPVIITTTSTHLSRAADAVMKRFPKDARPGKNALLNDIASALRPGKNWGGLLDEAKKPIPTTPKAPASDTDLEEFTAFHAVSGAPRQGHGPILNLEAVERSLPQAEDMSLPFEYFLEPVFTKSGEMVVGVVADIDEGYGYSNVDPRPDLLLHSRDGSIFQRSFWDVQLPAEGAELVLNCIQEVAGTRWPQILSGDGEGSGKVIVGPTSGAVFVSRSSWSPGQKTAPAPVVILARPLEGWETPEDRNILLRLAELSISLTSKPEIDARISLPDHNQPDETWTPIDYNFPEEEWQYEFVIAKKGLDWEEDSYEGIGIAPLLGEAMAFAMDFHGFPRDPYMFIEGRGDPMPGKRGRYICKDWRFLQKRGDEVGEWKLRDPEQHALLRRHVEAWITSEKTTLSDTLKRSMTSMTMLAERPGRRNNTHWERARKMFSEIG